MKPFEVLKQLDAYPRLLESYARGTIVGATATLISASIITVLVVLELVRYSEKSVSEELFVDTTRNSKLKINLDVVIPKLSCDYLSLDATDYSGNQDVKVVHNVKKIKLDLFGNEIRENLTEPLIFPNNSQEKTGNSTSSECGSCYGAAQRCCNTCEEVIEAYREKRWEPNYDDFEQCKERKLQKKLSEFRAFQEGCHMLGYMEVNRIGGNFHIAPGKSFSVNHIHVHDVQPFSSSDFNLTHIFRHLSFGGKLGIVDTNPLDGTLAIATEGSTSFQYYIKIIPTMYIARNGSKTFTNQFSFAFNKKIVSPVIGESGMPGIFFTYELSPLMVKYTEKERSLGHLATNMCSIIGGVFTVSGIIVSFIRNSVNVMWQKLELGKLN
uniref:Endoplasmic reticulum-Golgi intermediate compartment protein 3 n=1 Tax=Tabanus bromius TaxID=304241 RepID=A0A0K8TPB3_TABBR